jgi:regulator of replication initiation timing
MLSHQRSSKAASGKVKDIEGGIHPLCEFCRECFFADDELFAHMRETHEECFVCKRNDVRDQ